MAIPASICTIFGAEVQERQAIRTLQPLIYGCVAIQVGIKPFSGEIGAHGKRNTALLAKSFADFRHVWRTIKVAEMTLP